MLTKPACRQTGNPHTTKCARCSLGIATVVSPLFVRRRPRNDEQIIFHEAFTSFKCFDPVWCSSGYSRVHSHGGDVLHGQTSVAGSPLPRLPDYDLWRFYFLYPQGIS